MSPWGRRLFKIFSASKLALRNFLGLYGHWGHLSWLFIKWTDLVQYVQYRERESKLSIDPDWPFVRDAWQRCRHHRVMCVGDFVFDETLQRRRAGTVGAFVLANRRLTCYLLLVTPVFIETFSKRSSPIYILDSLYRPTLVPLSVVDDIRILCRLLGRLVYSCQKISSPIF